MAKVIVTFSLMPEGPDVDLAKVIEEVKKKPRREKGRYVPVSELKKPTPIKKIPKKKEEPKKVVEKEKVDLDSLLEERGLADKKKKSEK